MLRCIAAVLLCLLSHAAGADETSLHSELRTLDKAQLQERLQREPEALQGPTALWLAYKHMLQPERSRRYTDLAAARLDPAGVEARLVVLLGCVADVQTGSIPAATRCSDYRAQITAITDPTLRIAGWHMLTLFYASAGLHRDALVYAQLALNEARAQSYAVATMHNNMGMLLQQQGLPVDALKHFEQAQQALREAPDPEMSRTLEFNLGVSQLDVGWPEKARDAFTNALQWVTQEDNDNRYAIAVVFLSKAHLELKEPVVAIELLTNLFARDGLEIDLNNRLHARQMLAVARIQAGQIETGLMELRDVLSTAMAAGNEARIDDVSLQLAQHEPSTRALAILNPLVDRLENARPSSSLNRALQSRAIHKANVGDYAGAFADERRALEIQRELHSEKFESQLNLVQAKLDLEQQARELAQAMQREQEFKLQSQLSTLKQAGLLVFGLLLLLVAYLSSSRRLQMQAAEREREASQALEAKVVERTQALEQSMAERLNIEEDRRQLQQRLIEGEKLRALGQLTGGVAHDFNNLMTIVRMSAELLRSNPSLEGSPALQYVKDIENAAKSASDITSDLLAYARRQPLKPERVDLAAILADNQALFRRTLGASIELELELTPCHVLIDPSQLITCILNLLLNAAEAMQGSGRIQLSAQQSTTQSDGWAEIRIVDTGKGMDAATLSRATEPFFTTKDIGEGSGLGLSMVYGFAKQSGGDLHIESRPGAGTEVILRLPTLDAQGQILVAEPAQRTLLEAGRARLLVVEDQPQVREVMQRLLESQGFEVDVVVDGDQARRRLEQNPAYDMLITDVVMPGATNGYELSRYAKRRAPDMAVLVISGYAIDHDTGFEFLSKPFSLEELLNTVVDILDRQPPRQPREQSAQAL